MNEKEELKNDKHAAGCMNTSEFIAYLWLIDKKGYKRGDILFNHTSTPDFLCNDGKKYEVKRLYGRSVLVYDKQVPKLEGCTILVVDTEKRQVIKEFEWDKREEILVPAIKITRTGLHIYLSQEFERRILLLGLDAKGVNNFITNAVREKLNKEESKD